MTMAIRCWTLALLLPLPALSLAAPRQEQPPAPPTAAGKPAQPRPMTPRERADALKSPDFSGRVAQAALDQLLEGFQTLNPVRVMLVFDRDKLPDYAALDERVHSLMARYDGFRGFFHVEAVSEAGGRGSATASLQFERLSSDGSAASDRRTAQVRFQMERSAKGWKIVSFEPRGFFTQ